MKPKVKLKKVTKKNLAAVLKLNVAESQSGFVASNAISIAQAHFEPNAWFRAIYAGDVAVGFVMLDERPKKGYYCLWRFMIDEAHQGRGYGREVMHKIIKRTRKQPRAERLLTSYVPGEGCPEPFYRKLGFEPTGELDHGEVVLALEL